MQMLDQIVMFRVISVARLFQACLAIAGGLLLIPGAARADYIVTDVSSPGDPAFTQLLGINNSSTIAGYFGDGVIVPNNGFTLTLPNNFTSENFPGSVQTQVVGINSVGDTAGFFVDAGGNTHGFTHIGGVFSTVDDPASPTFNQLLSLNNSDEAAGYYQLSNGNQFAYTVSGGAFTSLASFFPIGTTISQATGVNNAGEVSGFYGSSGFLLNGGILTTLNLPGAMSTQALGLNNNGQVVGDYVDAGGVMHGFVFDGVNFKSFDVSGSVATTINGINNQGQIVGFFTDANQNTIGFVGNPTPEPRASTLAALAVVVIGLFWRSKFKADS
jgi:hypothetical protein